MEDTFLSPAMVAELTGIKVGALAQLRYEKKGPRYYKPSPKTILYRRSEVLAWLEGSAHPTKEFA
jgi:hypothetical protein